MTIRSMSLRRIGMLRGWETISRRRKSVGLWRRISVWGETTVFRWMIAMPSIRIWVIAMASWRLRRPFDHPLWSMIAMVALSFHFM